jgi:aminopeptidase N
VGTSGTLSFTHNSYDLIVSLAAPVNTDELFSFTVYYHGNPGGTGTFNWDTRGAYPLVWSISEPYGAREWWPCKDRMDDKADSMAIAVEIDTALYCGSNGTLDSVVNSAPGWHTYYYSNQYPIVTYLVSIAVSKYTVWSQYYHYSPGVDSMPIVHAVFPDVVSQSQNAYAPMPLILEILSDNFGQYPFIEEKYGHALTYLGGGMEHQTMTSIGPYFNWLTGYIHEAAHQWYGDMITCESWQDIWLNEGFASYAEAVWYLEISGQPAYQSYMNGMAYTGGGSVYVDDTTNVGRIFSGDLSYDKGAWVVHMLRGVLGDSLFFACLDAYYNSEYKYGAATTEEFKNLCEQTTGVELDWFFDEWVHGQYLPNYHYSYTSLPSDSGGYDTYLIIQQKQTTSPNLFHNPIDMVVTWPTLPEDTIRLTMENRREVYKMHFSEAVSSMALDPADWILKLDSYLSWSLYIVSAYDDLSEAEAYEPYLDTIDIIGGSGDLTFTLTNGTWPSGIGISNDGVLQGFTSDTGTFVFDIHVWDNQQAKSDQATFTMHVKPYAGCCGQYTGGVTGNTNCDVAGDINLADITRLVDYVYVSGLPLCCPENGEITGDAFGPNLSDITTLIDHVYISGQPTASCF